MTCSSPEENLAKRLVRRHSLRPPIDVDALARRYADVEERAIPVGADGITLDLKHATNRPKIVLNSLANSNFHRRRFTLAHELGHVLIPWHLGTIIDNTNEAAPTSSGNDYWTIEAEANRFASELLMPSDWIDELIAADKDPERLTAKIGSDAAVSIAAATIKLSNKLPRGFVYAQLTSENVVITSGRSAGTIATSPSWGSKIAELDEMFPSATRTFEISIGTGRYVWWEFPREASLPPPSKGENWRELLDEILADLGLEAKAAAALKKSANSVIAFANGTVKGADRKQEAVYAACLQRYQSNAAMASIRDHAKFETFLGARVRALFSAK